MCYLVKQKSKSIHIKTKQKATRKFNIIFKIRALKGIGIPDLQQFHKDPIVRPLMKSIREGLSAIDAE